MGVSRLLTITAVLWPLFCPAKTLVFITIDVESYNAGAPETQIWGELPAEPERWGITRIMDILDRHGARGTFYLTPYESAKHGESLLAEAAKTVIDKGHDLQLHTHPLPMFGVQGLAGLSIEEQVHILRTGRDLLEQWTGYRPIAHRSGAYKADENTLRALDAIGMEIDASLSYSGPLSKTMVTDNRVQSLHGITELPVSFYHPVRLPTKQLPRLVDIEASSLAELKKIVAQASDAGLCTVNLMMHSFSLSRYGTPDPGVAKRFDQFVEYVSAHPNLEIVTTREFHQRLQDGFSCDGEPPFVPHTGLGLMYLRAVEDFDKGRKNKVLVLAGIAAALLILVTLALLIRRVVSSANRIPRD